MDWVAIDPWIEDPAAMEIAASEVWRGGEGIFWAKKMGFNLN
jgi:hypothetical protein